MPAYVSLINFTDQGLGTTRDTLGQKHTWRANELEGFIDALSSLGSRYIPGVH